ncbi:uncharacterized protein LOC121738532 isoform X3 [Aricia agestis]|nr:uncharacterized protein LOC121738532 isoform X3 [Aricia agestis]
MRRNSPVQQWLDSLPPDVETPIIVTTTEQSSAAETAEESKKTDTKSDENKAEDTVTENTVVENNIDLPHDDSDKTEVPVDKESIKTKLLETKSFSTKNKSKLKRDHSIQSEGNPPRFKNPLLRDHSLQSDGSGSSGSSVLNVLGARRVDAESVLLALGFGPSEKQQQLQRIPDRFLSPSKLKGISTEEFIKHEQHSMRMHDCGIFGYRGLTGNPHVPPSTIVAKILERIIQDDVFREEALMKARHSFADMRSSTAQSKIPSRLRST